MPGSFPLRIHRRGCPAHRGLTSRSLEAMNTKRRRIGCREHPIRRLVPWRKNLRKNPYLLEGASSSSASLNSGESTALFSRAIL